MFAFVMLNNLHSWQLKSVIDLSISVWAENYEENYEESYEKKRCFLISDCLADMLLGYRLIFALMIHLFTQISV